MSLIFSPGGPSVSYMGKLRFVRTRPTAAFVVAAALLASMLVASPAASAAPTVFVCDNEVNSEKVVAGEGDDAKFVRLSFVHGVNAGTKDDPGDGSPRTHYAFPHQPLNEGETVAAYAYEDGADASTTSQARVNGHVIEQTARSHKHNWGDSAKVECSDTPFVVTADELTAGVQITVGISWAIDCADSDFAYKGDGTASRGGLKAEGPIADYDTIKACGSYYGKNSKVQVDRNTGEFSCKDSDYTDPPDCKTKASAKATTTTTSSGSRVAGGKKGSHGGAGDIGAVGPPGSEPVPDAAPGSSPEPQPEPQPEPEPDPQPVPQSGGTTSGGYQPEPEPTPTTTVPERTVEEEHNDAKDEDNDGCLDQQEYRAAITSIAQQTSTNWNGMSANDAYKDAHSRRC